MDLSTIVVSYNTFDLTRTAIETALVSGERGGDRFLHEVVVVDNASPDGSAARLAKAFASDTRVRVVANPSNVGFSGANNQGAALASGRHLFFLNPDTRTLDDALSVLVQFLDAHPEVGAVGPLVLNPDGSVQPSIMPFPSLRRMLHYHFPVGDVLKGRSRRTDPTRDVSGPVDGVSGCALAISRRSFDLVGGWDERIFMYAEENDLCWRLHHANRPSYYLREARIVHLGGQSTPDQYPEQQVHVQRSTLAFIRRVAPHLVALDRVVGSVSFALREGLYRGMARLRPEQRESLLRRARASRLLWQWYLMEHQ